MRIAVYARALRTKPTGRGMLAREMVQALRRVRPDVEIHLFSGEDPGWNGVSWRPATGSGLAGEAWRSLRGIARDVAGIHPDAIWSATHVLPYGLPADLPKIVTLLDVVWRDHPETMSARNRYVSAWQERGLHQADRIACISAFTRGRLASHWPELAAKADVVHLAASRTPAAGVPSPDARPYVLNVDTLEPRKNLEILADAIGQLQDVDFVHCGSVGWGMAAWIDRVQSVPAVSLRGYVPDAELDSLYRGAIAAVFPSIYEGFHLPPLDAMNTGCPVIASDIPVHREVLGDAALFVPCDDAGAWADAIRRLKNDGQARARLAAAGRERARSFSWDQSARTLVGVIQSAIEARAFSGSV